MWKGKAYQGYTTFSLGVGSISMGLLFVWPSYTLSMLTSSSSTILTAPISEGEGAMLGSLPSLGAMAGSTCVPILINLLGRKGGSLFLTLLYIISWIMVIFTRSIIVILVARFLGGLAGGATDCIGPIYISEIADDNIRGGLVIAILMSNSFGMIISYFIGWYCDYYTIAYINLAIAIFRIFFLIGIPESPIYLMRKKKIESARTSISKFRGVSPNSMIVEDEIIKIKQQISSSVPLDSINENGQKDEKAHLTSEDFSDERPSKLSAIKNLCRSPASRKAFFIVFTCYTFQIIMGNLPISVYAKQVFEEYDPSSADLCSVIFSVVWFFGLVLSSTLTDKFGRRIILMTSSSCVGVSLVLLGVFFQTNAVPPWASVLVIMLYIFFYLFGTATVPYVLMSELFSREVQTLASMLLIQWSWLGTFFILAVFNWLNKLIGIYGTFYIFAFNSLLSVVFTYFVIPETKGLSNKQIQLTLIKGRGK